MFQRLIFSRHGSGERALEFWKLKLSVETHIKNYSELEEEKENKHSDKQILLIFIIYFILFLFQIVHTQVKKE